MDIRRVSGVHLVGTTRRVMAEDDDQREGARVSRRAVPEVEVPRPDAGEEMDVSEATVRVDVPSTRPAPTHQEVDRQVQVQVQAMNRDERDTKRVKFAESRDERRQGRKNNISTLTLKYVPTKLAGQTIRMRAAAADTDGEKVQR